MCKIAIVADPSLSTGWARTLSADGHVVDTFDDPWEYQSELSGDQRDIVILDVTNPNFGETMLIPQTKAAWPDCRTIAVVSSYTFRSSAVYEMGLWTPDQLLIKPVASRLLAATVSFLWAQIRSQQIKKIVEEVRELAAKMSAGSADFMDLPKLPKLIELQGHEAPSEQEGDAQLPSSA